MLVTRTDTDIWRTADDMVIQTEAAMSPTHRALYARHIVGLRNRIRVALMTNSPAALRESCLRGSWG